jgi:iron(III) transport system ATP-binding protein
MPASTTPASDAASIARTPARSDSMPPGITIRTLTKTFPAIGAGRGSVTHAVDAVSLDITPGDLFFLLGPSGCGKTTLLRMIAGFIDPTAGTIAFGSRDVTHVAPNKRNTGMVFQSYALWPHMTVADNVAFGLTVRKISADERARRVNEALAAVRMEQYAARKPNQLSGGQQQRVALARALVIRPDVLLLDEPLSNLDAKLRLELRSEIRRICKSSGITGVYVTHDQKEALSMADTIAVMERGKIVQVGTPEQLYRLPANRFVAEFIGETNLIPGTIAERTGDSAIVQIKAGKLRSRASAGGLGAGGGTGAGAACLVSIRPEAATLVRDAAASAAENTLPVTIEHTTYLGEIAQHAVRLADGTVMHVSELNPLPGIGATGINAAIRMQPADVVVLPV